MKKDDDDYGVIDFNLDEWLIDEFYRYRDEVWAEEDRWINARNRRALVIFTALILTCAVVITVV